MLLCGSSGKKKIGGVMSSEWMNLEKLQTNTYGPIAETRIFLVSVMQTQILYITPALARAMTKVVYCNGCHQSSVVKD